MPFIFTVALQAPPPSATQPLLPPLLVPPLAPQPAAVAPMEAPLPAPPKRCCSPPGKSFLSILY